jgi:fluoroquinolone resistance protein
VFDLRFTECRLTSRNFTDIKMKLCAFMKCEIAECDFQNTFLVEVDFSQTSQTIFHNRNLQKASFLGAHGYSIDPRNNNVKKAAFSVPDVLPLLDGFEITIKEYT